MTTTLLSINNYYYYRGGAETVFLEQNKMFQQIGWRVVPFAMKHAKNLDSEWSGYFVDEIEFGEEYSAFQKLIRVPKVVYSVEAQQKLTKLIAEIRPDICHAHNIYHHISPSILHTLKKRDIPTVLTLHDLKVACPAYNMLSQDGICERCRGGRTYNVLVHRCIKGSVALSAVVMIEAMAHQLLGSYRQCVDRFIVPSRFYIDKLISWGMPADLFVHAPNFVEAARYEPQYEPGKYFLYFGRLSREKGLTTLIKAAAVADLPIPIHFVGTGPQLAELQQLAEKLKVNARFSGYLSGTGLHDAIRSAAAVVLPSEWYENAPMSILEAYALGKPVIGARIGGVPELIKEGRTGLTFTSGDVQGLADALQSVSSEGLREMGRQGRIWVEEEFSMQRYRNRIMQIYGGLGVRMDS